MGFMSFVPASRGGFFFLAWWWWVLLAEVVGVGWVGLGCVWLGGGDSGLCG